MYNEASLIKLVNGGSEQSFQLLYEHWVSRLYSFVYHYVKSEDITDDIVQETFIRIWTHREQLNPACSFKSYLFTIAYRLLIKELRRQVNNPLMSEYLCLNSEPSASNNNSEQQMDFNYFVNHLQEAKKKLSPRQKEIFELNKEQDVTVKEISIRLEIEEQVVRNQLSSALKVLRNELSHYLPLLLFLETEFM